MKRRSGTAGPGTGGPNERTSVGALTGGVGVGL